MNHNSNTATVFDNIDSRKTYSTDIQPTMSQSNNTAPSSSQSYSSKARTSPQTMFPKKDQAIVIHAVEPYKLSDYVKSLGSIIQPKNIIFASRISNNRICIYLSSTQTVDDLMKTHCRIKLGDIEVPIRRLITPAKRIVISNVCPSIPHEVVEIALKNLDLKLVSPISFLRAGIPGDEFSHILSFRRQVYISPSQDDNTEIPTSIVISYEETNYRIFLSTDTMECFICKKSGHVANDCPNTSQEFPVLNDPTGKSKKRPASPTSISEEIVTAQVHSQPPNEPPQDTQSFKSPNSLPIVGAKQTAEKHQTKKPKNAIIAPATENSESYKIIHELFSKNPDDFNIPFDSFKNFLENSHGNSDPLNEARRITNDVSSLLKIMKMLYSRLVDRSLKNRFTRISKRVRKQLQDESLELSSNFSFGSQTSQDEMEVSLIDISDDPKDCTDP